MKRVEVDFNMFEDGYFVAVADDLTIGEVFRAVDAEGHEMIGHVHSGEGNTYFFAESSMVSSTSDPASESIVFRGIRPSTPVQHAKVMRSRSTATDSTANSFLRDLTRFEMA